MQKPFYRSLAALALAAAMPLAALASSHREAPLISNDPLADNTDLYAFRSPDDPNTITIIANYIPFESPEGGPNYYTFGENIRYEIHVDNDATKPGDEVTYRFTFTRMNEDPSTFFNIRLGKQNLKTTYTCEKSTDNGATWSTIVTNGIVPPANIGPRSINGAAGLNTNYRALMTSAMMTAASGETVFCGPIDDPFFVDLGGIFDLGQTRDKNGIGPDRARDGVAGYNCHTIALKIPIQLVQKAGKAVSMAANILDPDFVIGVWASASRPKITTLRTDGGKPDVSGEWVQVSRLGMPLTNEAVIPLLDKDRWNATSPYDQQAELSYAKYFVNPELALYMDDSQFGGAVPALAALRIQTNSLGAFDFRNGKDGLFGKLTSEQRAGTALADDAFGPVLLQPASPRSVDILPIFYTGVPNLRPYQLATGKPAGNPLAAGKPFIHNFLPSLGDMLRLNMAVPPTPRTSPDFSSEGALAAAVLGLTDPRFNANADLQAIPNMDGFPNGRRLEDDVTRIELQAVSGIALAAIGLGYEENDRLGKVIGYSAGPDKNDLAFSNEWPYVAEPHRGYDYSKQLTTAAVRRDEGGLGITAPAGGFTGRTYPNPTRGTVSIGYRLTRPGMPEVVIYDLEGRAVATIDAGRMDAGTHAAQWSPASDLPAGRYMAELRIDGASVGSTTITYLK